MSADPSAGADTPSMVDTFAIRRDLEPTSSPRATWNPQLAVAIPEHAPTTSLVIPARNEARNLPFVLERLPACVDEVILVDGCSSDATAITAKSCRPDIRIITEPRRGKGYALRAVFQAAHGDLIIAMDGDGSMSPEEIPQFVYFLEHGYDFVKGSRFVGGGGSLDLTRIRKLGNLALLAVANLLYGAHITDLCYGFFGLRARYLAALQLRSSGFEIETEIIVRACQCGLRIAEIPSLELPRRHGRSNLHAIRDGKRALSTLMLQRYAEDARRSGVTAKFWQQVSVDWDTATTPPAPQTDQEPRMQLPPTTLRRH